MPLRLYELDENDVKIFKRGYTSMQFLKNYDGEVSGAILLNFDKQSARVDIYDSENDCFFTGDLKKLYCKKCREKIKELNSDLNFVLMDYNDYMVYSVAEKIDKMKVRDYIISSKNSEGIEITVEYMPKQESAGK